MLSGYRGGGTSCGLQPGYYPGMDFGLRDRVAIIGGASQGIGRAVAFALAAEGVHLALCARKLQALEQVAEEITAAHGVRVLARSVDMGEDTAVRGLVEDARKEFNQIDIVVPNAGGPPAKDFLQTTMADWNSAFQHNLRSVVSMAQAALPHMQRRRWGRIVTITSYTAKQPAPGLVLSNAIRPGVAGLIRALATEFGPDGITANNVGPGFTDTARSRDVLNAQASRSGRSYEEVRGEAEREIPIGRIATPEEVAATVVWLCSVQAASTTGQTILVDGGSYRGL